VCTWCLDIRVFGELGRFDRVVRGGVEVGVGVRVRVGIGVGLEMKMDVGVVRRCRVGASKVI
jgi:hypothetical protein